MARPVKEKPLLPDAEYQAIKARWPNREWDDEFQSFKTQKGHWTYAKMLQNFIPIPKGESEIQKAAVEKKKENAKASYARYLQGLEKGLRPSDAEKAAGLTHEAVRNRRRADPEFVDAERQAEAVAAEPIEDSLWDAARNGNVPAAIKWLEKRSPERWPSDKMLVETKTTLELDATDRVGNILALMARLQERRELGLGDDVIDVEATEPTHSPRSGD